MFWDKRKCVLCGQRDDKSNLNKITYGSFMDDWIEYFHMECLKDVIVNSHRYPPYILERAIDIHRQRIIERDYIETLKRMADKAKEYYK